MAMQQRSRSATRSARSVTQGAAKVPAGSASDPRERRSVEPPVQERLREVAAELRRMLYGETGCPAWGTLFRDIEQDGMTVGLELARLLMEQSVSDQARHMPREAMGVPDDIVQPAGTDPVRLETLAGEVAWDAPCGRLK